ncbi:pyridoxal 5'-phosphate synthase [Kitasatospora sp. GAS204B]|uniref:pyridoxine/pyridoxamine 5'-phosphate oxidase n=1 Tax=unclassified Kitasatospora TaxID=2633591 RepID=UPI002476A34D|nr:pyridoxamine 5'-phosphate oxidase family protein [Kitasatospora sp. GAS204B]
MTGGEAPAADLAALRELLLGRPAMARELPGFVPEAAPAGPGELFVSWLLDALRVESPDAQVVTLSTVGLDGAPDARIVVLRDVDPELGVWWFAGDARSPKGRQLAAEPRAALTWYWPALGRQVRVRGEVTPGDAAAAGEVFRLLSPKSRAAALVGRQSERLGTAQEFWAAWGAAERELAAEPGLVAQGYTQYGVRAREVEFWQGAADRRHLRLVYRRGSRDDGWRRELLWP